MLIQPKDNVKKQETCMKNSSETVKVVKVNVDVETFQSFTYFRSTILLDVGVNKMLEIKSTRQERSLQRYGLCPSEVWYRRNVRKRNLSSRVMWDAYYTSGMEYERTQNNSKKISQTFVKKCFSSITEVRWSNIIICEALWKLTGSRKIHTTVFFIAYLQQLFACCSPLSSVEGII